MRRRDGPEVDSHPSLEKPFPVPHKGIDESEGVVVFEATLPGHNGSEHRWVAIAYSTNEERGWVLGGSVKDEPIVRQFNVPGMYSTICYLPVQMNVPRRALQGGNYPDQPK